MGGDFAPSATVEGSVIALDHLAEDIEIVLIGDREKISSELEKYQVDASAFSIFHAPDIIEMGDHPTKSFAQKPNSSIAAGFGLLKKGKIDGFASAGNTGAMFVGGYMSHQMATYKFLYHHKHYLYTHEPFFLPNLYLNPVSLIQCLLLYCFQIHQQTSDSIILYHKNLCHVLNYLSSHLKGYKAHLI